MHADTQRGRERGTASCLPARERPMGTEADTNLLRNPLPKEWHPASLRPSPNTSSPPPGDPHSSLASRSPWARVSVAPRQRVAVGTGGTAPPQRVLAATRGCCSPTQGSAAQPVGAQRGRGSAERSPQSCCSAPHPFSPHGHRDIPPTHTSGSLFPAWSWGWHLRGTHVPNRGHLAAQLQSRVGKTQWIKFSFCQLHPRVCQRGAGKDGYLFQGTNL